MIVGLNYSAMHDSSVCVLDDAGRVVHAVSEERFSRVKQDGRFPRGALSRIALDEVEAIGVPYSREEPPPVASAEVFRDVLLARSEPLATNPCPEQWLRNLESLGRPLLFFDHHEMHAYAAFVLSGLSEALCVTSDYGAYCCPVSTGVFHVSANRVQRLAAAGHHELEPLAAMYTDVTALLGFTPTKHEGKVTGLAAHGIPADEVRDALWKIHEDVRRDRYRLYDWVGVLDEDVPPFLEPNRHLVAEYRARLPYGDADLARAAQDLLEEKMGRVLEWVAETYGTDLPLLLSGGLFANVRLNLHAARIGFRSLFVCPPMGDEGLAVGAARAAYEQVVGPVAPGGGRPLSMALGPTPGPVERVLRDLGVRYRRESPSVVRDTVVATLAAGGTVALVRGAQEFGPRALGRRSILASAQDPEINDRLNQKLRRTEFMPFAPLLRDVRFDEVFDLSDVRGDVSPCLPFMTICLPVRREVAARIPAVVHVDGTARPQVVREEDDPELYALLAAYEETTGAPALINTSFNIHDEPLVSDTTDAVSAFLVAELDLLVVEDCLVPLEHNREAAALVRATERAALAVGKARHRALNESFGRQIVDGPGRFDPHFVALENGEAP
ncbi:carbamoyltransferase [Streptoalloteichus tenebrarius]|uniref:Carbamoyltransferase n=1 Tax=Streptoalloteichus tenebrarius (strain ATCC 17920 / DSM 40477 / JCM 4838 / CBS 697.72 / NBRC 16177 / NCIMB 11028 / NRRL B-12390 / A12253. 1 / ISP 5477) TaxID=1933 RepID=A0ABT1HLI5_STRSD|nr:carbamoyltransferase C-terminal domain-containing protein [Streptoalloteichus tenebrarius]MCP2256392.1 carbamoyltransferase [Streptoalloteichus tenebrarius]BFF04739.1 carbamoyltransferase [Streptoalloteichus tenebrarius]